MTEKVTLYIYDTSNGMAKAFGKAFVGKDVEAIYHTSVVVFGKEFYFQGGIAIDKPKTTPFGQPIKEQEIGTTELSSAEFAEFLESIKGHYTADKYDLFGKNCNHFSNEVCEFLTGKGIPAEILNQAKEYENTPIGQMLGNLQNQMMGKAPANPGLANAGPPINFDNLFAPQPQTHAPGHGATPQHTGNVTELSTIDQYLAAIGANNKIVIDFYADWCGPCKMIKPTFHQLADKYNKDIKFFQVNVDMAGEVAQNFQIKAMPTFIAIFKGEQVDVLKGADPNKLTNLVDNLSKKVL